MFRNILVGISLSGKAALLQPDLRRVTIQANPAAKFRIQEGQS